MNVQQQHQTPASAKSQKRKIGMDYDGDIAQKQPIVSTPSKITATTLGVKTDESSHAASGKILKSARIDSVPSSKASQNQPTQRSTNLPASIQIPQPAASLISPSFLGEYASAPVQPTTPLSPLKQRKAVPIRSIKSPTSVEEKLKEQIIQLDFAFTSLEQDRINQQSQQQAESMPASPTSPTNVFKLGDGQRRQSVDNYMNSLLSYHRAKYHIHQLRMKRRHERILSGAPQPKSHHRHHSQQIDEDSTRGSRPKRMPPAAPKQRQPVIESKRRSNGRRQSTGSVGTSNGHMDVPRERGQRASSSSSSDSSPVRERHIIAEADTAQIQASLTQYEIEFAHANRLRLNQYASLKQQMKASYEKHGYFNKTAARRYVRGVDVVRLGIVWEFMNEIGVLHR